MLYLSAMLCIVYAEELCVPTIMFIVTHVYTCNYIICVYHLPVLACMQKGDLYTMYLSAMLCIVYADKLDL